MTVVGNQSPRGPTDRQGSKGGLLFLAVAALLAWSVPVPSAGAAEEPDDALLRLSHKRARDNEYISYVETLALDEETRTRLWEHLTRKHELLSEFETRAQEELGDSYNDDVKLVVITYDRNSQEGRRLQALQQQFDAELRDILTEEQIERHAKRHRLLEEERFRRSLRHRIEDMELDLSHYQFELAMDIFEAMPDFGEDSPDQRGASGYSSEYMVDRREWRFEEQQAYLERELLPILDDEQAKRFRTWQEVQRITLERELEAYQAGAALMAKMYPAKRRQVRILLPSARRTPPDEEPLFAECRNNELFVIPVAKLNRLTSEKMRELAKRVRGDTRRFKTELARAVVETEAHRVDLSYGLLAQFAILPRPAAAGYDLETLPEGLEPLLLEAKEAGRPLSFIVRDDSFEIFKRARELAAAHEVEIAHEVIGADEPIKLGLGGLPMRFDAAPDARAEQDLPPFFGGRLKTPTYIEVRDNSLVLYPEETRLSAADLGKRGTPLNTFLDDVEANKQERYIALLLRPRSTKVARRLKKLIRDRGIDYGEEFYEPGRPVEISRLLP